MIPVNAATCAVSPPSPSSVWCTYEKWSSTASPPGPVGVGGQGWPMQSCWMPDAPSRPSPTIARNATAIPATQARTLRNLVSSARIIAAPPCRG
jgi:hypothetical protein